MLPYALMAYRTSIRTSTGATPYSLVYGMEVVLPIEVEIPSLRVLAEAKILESAWAQVRHDQLNLIDEKRLQAMSNGQAYQRRMATTFNKRVRPRDVEEGDLVLKKVLPHEQAPRGQPRPNYEGPFIVKQKLSDGALLLGNMDGEDFPDL